MTNTECLFCQIVAGEIPSIKVYSTDRIFAFRDIKPAAPIHTLVIPKQHYADAIELTAADPALAGELLVAATQVAEEEGLLRNGYRIVLNSGRDAGQIVRHVHAHVLGGAVLGPIG